MAKRNKINYPGLVLGIGAVAALALWYSQLTAQEGAVMDDDPQTPIVDIPQTPSVGDDLPVTNNDVLPQTVTISVPFFSQAPFGEWDDPRQQDGCEEASVGMAKWWIEETRGTLQQAKDQVLALSAMSEEMFGTYHDTSAADTLKMLQRAVPSAKARVVYDITVEMIKAELAAGRIVLTPANGQKLGNPNFSGAGPERHMLVIKGYDEARKQFITNDPGTRKGEGYRYSYNVLINALVDYPTGYHEPITNERKAMITVAK